MYFCGQIRVSAAAAHTAITIFKTIPYSSNVDKKRIIKDYDSLPEDVVAGIKMQYPKGFAQHLVFYTNKEGKRVSALPFDTGEIYYLVRMTVQEAQQIIEDDEDYDDDGVLRDDFTVEDYSNNEGHFESSPVGFHSDNLMYGASEEDEQTERRKQETNLLTGMSDEELEMFAGENLEDLDPGDDDDDDDDEDFADEEYEDEDDDF